MKLNAKQLRVSQPTEKEKKQIERRPVWLVLDDVLDTYNIGGLFRLADAVGVRQVMLCAGSETPPSSRIHKAAVGTESWVSWKYYGSAIEALLEIKAQFPKLKILVVEQDSKAISLDTLDWRVPEDQPLAVVVGHETEGVSQEVRDLADIVVEIPMWGVNRSLNVIVSAAIVMYRLLV